MTAAASQSLKCRIVPAVLCGRRVRYGVESALVYYFGRGPLASLNSNALGQIIYGMIEVVTVGSTVMFY